MPNQQITLLNQSITLGDVAYEGFEHVAAVLEGLRAIAGDSTTSERMKIIQIERITKAALYLTHDYAALVDAEEERAKEALKEVSHAS